MIRVAGTETGVCVLIVVFFFKYVFCVAAVIYLAEGD